MARKPLVFVVDDDGVTRLMLTRFLQRNGYETESLENGELALAAFQRRIPDIVLMDARMPVMDGFQACSLLKEQPEARHVPVLMITALNDDESVDRAFEAGAADFIPKPIHWAILRNRVNYLIQSVQAERQLYLAASVYDNTNEGIVVTDAAARIQSINPAFVRITGYDAEEVLGQSMNLLKSGRHDHEFYTGLWRSLTATGKWQGEIWNRRKSGEIYPQWINISAIKSQSGLVTNYVGIFSDLTTLKESEANLLHISGHDLLTDLPNRLLFHERLNHAIADARRHGGLAAILMLDLDRFKVINDTVGHDVGDQIIMAVAERLNECMPPNATLARLGGDEFGVVFPRLPTPQDAGHLARAMLDELTAPFLVEEMTFFLGASIGISLFPLDGADVKTLVKNADAAMYHAKEQGRNNYQFYRNQLNAFALTRMLLESSLRNAVDKEEFLLFYQPQVDLSTGALIGMEALIRWRHPEKGMVSPGEFIPLAEETGLIIPMGLWALRTACRQAKRWQDMGYPPLRVAVNLSGIQFKQPDFTEMVTRVLEQTGLAPQWLELELTESIAMGNVQETLEKLNTLAGMGLFLAIDDFGTGFSSLSYLKRFPIHTLKIDRSFVNDCTTDPENAAIIRTVIALAHSMNLKVIAEGVETVQQLEFLRSHRCDEIQGYLYSPPLPMDKFRALMEENRIIKV